MTENYPNIDALLAKKFAGEITSGEEATIAEWLRASPDNARYLAEAQWLWEQMAEARIAPETTVDTEKALQKVKFQWQPAQPGVRAHSSRYWWPAVAAAFVLAVAAIYFFSTNAPVQPASIAAQNNLLTDTLTDGSVVTLNRHSDLVIASGFNRRERRMRLNGEGYFKVARDTGRPFVVDVQALEVTVVGTAFNINALSIPGSVIVTVMEGKVSLKSGTQTELLTPGESAVYERATGKITRQTAPSPNVLAYQNRRFLFDATPLQTVIAQINAAYNIEITLENPDLNACPLSARFDNQPLERVLDILVETFAFEITRTGNTVVLKKGQCE